MVIVQCKPGSHSTILPKVQTVQIGHPADMTCTYIYTADEISSPIDMPDDQFDYVAWHLYRPGKRNVRLMLSYKTHSSVHDAYTGGRLVRVNTSNILNGSDIRLTSVEWEDEGTYQCSTHYSLQPNGSSFSSSWSGGAYLFVVGKYKF